MIVMNVSPALLHGEQVLVALVFAGLSVVIGLPALLYVWLWHTKLSELKLAIGILCNSGDLLRRACLEPK